MKIRIRIKTIFIYVIISCILLLVFSGIGVYAQNNDSTDEIEEQYFPFTTLPNDFVQEEKYIDRYIYSEKALYNLRQLLKGIFIVPRKKVENDFSGPEMSYLDGFYTNLQGELVNDSSLDVNPVKDWICTTQKENFDRQGMVSNLFCQSTQFLGNRVINPDEFDLEDYNPNDGSSLNQEEIWEICEDVKNKEVSVKGLNGKNYVIPVRAYNLVTSKYNAARFDSYGNLMYYHQGIDFAATSGTEVIAPNNGKVVKVGNTGAYGNSVIIEHSFEDGKEYTLYAHMLDESVKVSVGDYVAIGDVIGQVGSTGNSTGPHLHFEVRKIQNQWDGKCIINGTPCNSNINPESVIEFENVEELRNHIVEVSEGKLCLKTKEVKPPSQGAPEYTGEIDSFECMMGVAAKAVGNVPPQALYAISRNESTRCPKTWVGFAGISAYAPDPFGKPNTLVPIDRNTNLNIINYNTARRTASAVDNTTCTGDPTQIALASSNLWTTYDVRGVSQFVDSTFNSQLTKTDGDDLLIQKCIEALGVPSNIINVPPEDDYECRNNVTQNCLDKYWGYDNKSIDPENYSRHIVSHVVCAKAIKLRFDAGNKPVSQWTDETMYNVAWDYYGHGTNVPGWCDAYGNSDRGDYCDNAVKNFKNTSEEIFECGNKYQYY